jgi:hypothetical protein
MYEFQRQIKEQGIEHGDIVLAKYSTGKLVPGIYDGIFDGKNLTIMLPEYDSFEINYSPYEISIEDHHGTLRLKLLMKAEDAKAFLDQE